MNGLLRTTTTSLPALGGSLLWGAIEFVALNLRERDLCLFRGQTFPKFLDQSEAIFNRKPVDSEGFKIERHGHTLHLQG